FISFAALVYSAVPFAAFEAPFASIFLPAFSTTAPVLAVAVPDFLVESPFAFIAVPFAVTAAPAFTSLAPVFSIFVPFFMVESAFVVPWARAAPAATIDRSAATANVVLRDMRPPTRWERGFGDDAGNGER